ncbi:hypothetical protein NHF41_05865 [Pseudomonas proteolytica]|nr:hypothetical protein [Pseudomonas proteolytica]USX01394.1 hypothetical protein NHF41_05865 [Pseudomonas proteolytica]
MFNVVRDVVDDTNTRAKTGPRFVAPEERLRALLDITGHLDKAQTLIETLPTWLEAATPGALEALEKAHAESEAPRQRARRLLNRVKPLDTFCAEQLTAFFGHQGAEHP